MRSKSTSATVNNLKPSTAYVFQIRAFTEAGYGTYGPRLEITTKEEATGRMYIKNARVHICFIQYCLVVHLYGRDKYIITV